MESCTSTCVVQVRCRRAVQVRVLYEDSNFGCTSTCVVQVRNTYVYVSSVVYVCTWCIMIRRVVQVHVLYKYSSLVRCTYACGIAYIGS